MILFLYFWLKPSPGLSSSAESLSHFRPKPFRKDAGSLHSAIHWNASSLEESLGAHPQTSLTCPNRSFKKVCSQEDGLGNTVVSNHVPSKAICLAEPCSSPITPDGAEWRTLSPHREETAGLFRLEGCSLLLGSQSSQGSCSLPVMWLLCI